MYTAKRSAKKFVQNHYILSRNIYHSYYVGYCNEYCDIITRRIFEYWK